MKNINGKMDIPEELLDRDLLFHYTKTSVAIEKILFEKKIRFSSLAKMNDPYEYKMLTLGVWARGGIPEQTAHEILSQLRKTVPDKPKILCLVNNCGEDGIHNPAFTKPRLWAQYGEAQYGVCLVLSREATLEKIKSAYPKMSIYEDYVDYDLVSGGKSRKNHPQYDKLQSPDENVRSHIKANRKDIFFRKHEDFRDENEYRIVLIDWMDSGNSDVYIDLQGVLKGVILGERFHQVYLELMKSLVINLRADLYRIAYGSKIYVQKYDLPEL